MSKKNPYAPKTLAAVTPAVKKQEPAQPKEEQVPAGTIKEIMEWVGDDEDRARRVLEDEQGKDKPRGTLVDRLSDLLDSDTE